jgi:integrase
MREVEPEIRPQSASQKQRRYSMLIDFLGASRRVDTIDRASAGRFVTKIVQPLDRATATKKSIISDMHALMKWAMIRGLLHDNPFHLMTTTIKETSRGSTKGKPRPWTETELVKVFGEIDLHKYPKLFAGGALLLYTGARVEEVLTATKDALVENGTGLRVDEGKNETALRTIPIHPIIQPLTRWLSDATPDGYLLPGYPRRGKNKKRGDAFTRQLRPVQERLGVPIRANGGVAIHDLRRTFKTSAENCRLDQRMIDQIQGHANEGMRAVYSHGIRFEELIKETRKKKRRK